MPPQMESTAFTSSSVHNLPFVSAGVSSMVYAQSETAVIKAPVDRDRSLRALTIERSIYQRLGQDGQHPYITKLIPADGDFLVLERYQYPLRQKLWQLRNDNQVPLSRDVLRWAYQIAQALQHVHSCNVLQVDIGAHNILLDQNNDARLSDFAGSSIDGSDPEVFPSHHSQHPCIRIPSVQSEIFALGSTFYEIETTKQPYHNRTEREVQTLFKAQDFPDTGSLVLGRIIEKCWHMEFSSVVEVTEDLRKLQTPQRATFSGIIPELIT